MTQTSTTKLVEGLENFGEVVIRKITHRRSGARLSPRDGKWIGVVHVPVGYPGSSTVGAPEGCALMGVVSYDKGETWALL